MKRRASWIALIGFLFLTATAHAAEMTAEQKDAASKLQAKGALVIAVAANSDGLVVSLSGLGKTGTDAELALVKALPKVEQLDLRGTAITDAGLANLEAITTLTQLHLESTGVTDDGLAHLKGLTNLAYLNLYNTAVTDKGVAQLAGLKSLKKLYLWQTKVTEAGAAGLKKSLPELYVNRGEELAAAATQPAAKPMEKPADKPAPKPTDKPAKPADKPADKPAVKPTDKPVASAKPINTTCPLSGEDVDPSHFVVFEGKTIGFCCEKCQAKFAADPKKFIDKVVADAK